MKREHTVYERAVRIVIAAVVILLVPLVAMQFTDQVVWGPGDFAVAGALLIGTGLLYELAVRKSANAVYRIAVGVALAAAFLLIWINLAVGIIGEPDELANAMYFGVLAVGLIGAVFARFHPQSMAYALFATAFAQALVGAIVLIFSLGDAMTGRLETVVLNGLFVALFAGSALLFRRAARGSEHAIP